MRIAVTGASGLVGWPVARYLAGLGYEVTALGRGPVGGFGHYRWTLEEIPDLTGFDALVHAAFLHEPGRYRGGEGDDPEGFRRANLGGTVALWGAARKAGTWPVFLSTRAVYGTYPPGTRLFEETPARPDTLYGEVKLAAEEALGPGGTSLRITGVYGPPVPGRAHKWADLLESFEAGRHIAPRVSTEVHAEDVAAAVALVIETRAAGVVNVSDIVLDRRDLLETWAKITGRGGVLPPPADPGAVREMDTARLRGLGWQPRGGAGVREVLGALAAQ